MKSVGAIKHKLSQVRFRHLKKRLEAELRVIPDNCLYNKVLPGYTSLDRRGKAVEHHPVGICTFGAVERDDSWPVRPCDIRVDDGEQARSCAKFCPRRTKDIIKEDFQKKLDRMTLPEVAAVYPDMAALIWVLEAGDFGGDASEEVPVVAPVVEPTVVIPQEPLPVEVPPMLVEVPVPFVATSVVVQEYSPDEPKKPWYIRLLGVS